MIGFSQLHFGQFSAKISTLDLNCVISDPILKLQKLPESENMQGWGEGKRGDNSN